MILILIRGFRFYLSIIYLNKIEILIEWEVIIINSCIIHIIIIFDIISLYFLRLVRLISGSVIIFSTSYMIKEKFFSRFILLVFLFVISIYLLIVSPNIIRLLLGWDGLGVTSYLLVVFYQRNKSYNAGMITAITNRIGDVGLLISISLFIFLGSWNFIYQNFSNYFFSNMLVFLIIISSCTKSAQVPFSAWLPAAMAAPTPVSALVHSSTLVTAGVYLLIRINILIIEIDIRKYLFIIGILTMVMAGITAMIEIDIKKVIALSTLRQLGVIIIILGIGNPILSFFHLISHAFFKAILFMCAGIIIHNIKDYQDIRKIGYRFFNMHFSISIIIIANISLCGLPFISGFYSKDFIIEIILIKGKNLFFLFLMIFGTILTVIYSCRLNFLVSINFIKSECYYFINENSLFILIGIMFLLPFSILGGIIISWNIISSNKIIYIPLWIKSIVISLIIFSVIFFIFFYKSNKDFYKNIFLYFLSNMWFLPYSLNLSTNYFFLNNSLKIFKYIEISWSEIIIFKNFFNIINNNYLRKFFDFFSFIYLFQTIEIFILLIIVYFIIR